MKRFLSTDYQLVFVAMAVGLILLTANLLPLWAVVAFVFSMLLLSYWYRNTYQLPLVFSEEDEESFHQLLLKIPVGIIRFDKETHDLLWFNPYSELLFTQEDGTFDEALIQSLIQQRKSKIASSVVTINGNRYSTQLDEEDGYFYCFDTSLHTRESSFPISQPAIGIISVDNYDDVADDLSDADVSQVNGFIANFIARFTEENEFFYRRVAMDRFYFFTDYARLSKILEGKFEVLDRFKNEAQELNLPLTLSMGISYGTNHYQIGNVAQENLNIALVRGGDQAVVKEDAPQKKLRYYGGGSVSTVKRSRTRTRAMMTAISDKIRSADQVFVVGHRKTDMDSLGATIGMQRFAANLIADSYAVYEEEVNSDIMRALEKLKSSGVSNLIALEKAKKQITENSLLIMVDHSKTQLTLSRDFYERFTEVIVIDHHRRDDDFPDNAVLTFIESGASSASELVAELLQFQNARTKPSKLEASLLMAGIMLDTQNFSMRVTSRTFDVASYLRSLGSDSVEIQQISATDFEEYRQVNQLILTGRTIFDNIIIAMGSEDDFYSNVIMSKAADTLLSMAGIEASFVIAKSSSGTVSISARSRSKINVQSLMEDLGGGGHFNLAACQLDHLTISEAYETLIKRIKVDLERGRQEI